MSRHRLTFMTKYWKWNKNLALQKPVVCWNFLPQQYDFWWRILFCVVTGGVWSSSKAGLRQLWRISGLLLRHEARLAPTRPGLVDTGDSRPRPSRTLHSGRHAHWPARWPQVPRWPEDECVWTCAVREHEGRHDGGKPNWGGQLRGVFFTNRGGHQSFEGSCHWRCAERYVVQWRWVSVRLHNHVISSAYACVRRHQSERTLDVQTGITRKKTVLALHSQSCVISLKEWRWQRPNWLFFFF